PGGLHAAFVRSHLAHGRLRAIDVRAARAAPGVALVLTAADLDGVVGRIEPFGPPGVATPSYTALADDAVRMVGEPLVLVVADSRARAEDACELVDVETEPLPVVATIDDALDASIAPLFDDVGTNVMY